MQISSTLKIILLGCSTSAEGRDNLHEEPPKRQPHVNPMKLNKTKCKTLHLGQDNPKHKFKLGREWIEGSSEIWGRSGWMRGWT